VSGCRPGSIILVGIHCVLIDARPLRARHQAAERHRDRHLRSNTTSAITPSPRSATYGVIGKRIRKEADVEGRSGGAMRGRRGVGGGRGLEDDSGRGHA
jgi:hypothetical protein